MNKGLDMSSELTKQERLKIKREQEQQIVRAKVTYECGACGYCVVVPVEPNEYGLIDIADKYCGSCAKSRNFRPISGRITKLDIKTRAEWDAIDNPPVVETSEPEPESVDESSTGTKETDVPAKTPPRVKKVKRAVDKDGLDQ